MLQGFRCVGDHHAKGGQRSFVGKKWGSGWSHMMGEIWIHGEKGAQAVTEPEKSRQAQSVLLRQEGPGQLRKMMSQRNGDTEPGSSQGECFFFSFLLKF